MPLTLTVKSYLGAAPTTPVSISIEHERISIGRQKGNSLVLNDPENVVSGKHAEVEYRNDGYYITDTSTNGTAINQTEKTLGNGQTAKLNNNDLLTFGDYEVKVSITSQSSNDASQNLSYGEAQENSATLLRGDDTLDPALDDPFVDIESATEDKEDLLDQKAQNYHATDDFSFLDSLGESDQMSAGNGLPVPDTTDLFADNESAKEDDKKLSHRNAQTDDDFSFLKSLEDSDQVSVDNSLPAPDTTDFFADIWSAKEDNEEVSHTNIRADETDDEFSFLESIPGSNQSQADDDIPNSSTEKLFTETEQTIEEKNHLLNQHETANTQPRTTAQQPSLTSNTEVELEHIQSFLKGAGITNSNISSTINANTFYLIGEMLSSSLQGAIQVLWARSKIKGELGLEVTMVHGHRNNPLKFSPSAQESLIKMLSPQGDAYMPANEAIDEAFSDIGIHEMAVMAGMRSALQDVLKRFNPEHLEKRLQIKSPISVKIPIHKQARLWDLFQDLYDEIEKEAHDDFNHLFGRAFARAYDEQLKKLKNN